MNGRKAVQGTGGAVAGSDAARSAVFRGSMAPRGDQRVGQYLARGSPKRSAGRRAGSVSGSGQRAQSLERRAQDVRPGPAALQAQPAAAATTSEARRHVEEAVPKPLRLPAS